MSAEPPVFTGDSSLYYLAYEKYIQCLSGHGTEVGVIAAFVAARHRGGMGGSVSSGLVGAARGGEVCGAAGGIGTSGVGDAVETETAGVGGECSSGGRQAPGMVEEVVGETARGAQRDAEPSGGEPWVCGDQRVNGVRGAVVRGPGGGVSYGRGPNYVRNQEARARRKLARSRESGVPEWRRKPALREDDAVSDVVGGLRTSLHEKWVEENKLAKLKAIQQRELLEARDMEKLKKMQAAQVMRTTEQAKVQTEKAFGFLAKTGNIPGVVGEGYVEGTVLTNATPGLTRSAGDTISPDSSASMHEYRQALKAVADAEKKIADLERALARLRIVVPEETAEAERYAGARTTFTLDTDGEPPVADEGFIGDDGKYHTFQRLTHPDWTPSTEKAMAKQGLDMYYDDGY